MLASEPDVLLQDLSDTEAAIRAAARQGFDLTAEPPLRATLFMIEASMHIPPEYAMFIPSALRKAVDPAELADAILTADRATTFKSVLKATARGFVRVKDLKENDGIFRCAPADVHQLPVPGDGDQEAG